jgi:hypothetical protein
MVVLWSLANQLGDSGAANYFMGGMIKGVEAKGTFLDRFSLIYVYHVTLPGSPLRQMVMDWYVHAADSSWSIPDMPVEMSRKLSGTWAGGHRQALDTNRAMAIRNLHPPPSKLAKTSPGRYHLPVVANSAKPNQ